jgi:hypothetical protein
MQTTLPILEIVIVYSGGIRRYDPSTLMMAAVAGEIADLPGFETLLSMISGHGFGIIYMSNDVQLVLTAPELDRLCRHALEPMEVAALLAQRGNFFEIHEDFYDHSTGESLQSIPIQR